MAVDFDLNLSPVYRIQGQEGFQIPGLLAVLPPKRAARGREEDRLLVYLTLSGNSRFSSAEYHQIIDRIIQRFYRTSGSLTSAIRFAIGDLNQTLLKRNLHTTGGGEYVIGRLLLSVMRGGQLLIAQCGPTYVFHLTGGETKLVHDEQIAGRGLGISQATPLHFAQMDLHAGDLLMLCPNLPAAWNPDFLGEKNVSFATLRRDLLSIPGEDLNAVLIQVKVGKGNLNTLKGMPPEEEKPAPGVPGMIQETPIKSGPEVTGQDIQTDRLAIPATPRAASGTIPTSHVESGRPASRFARLLSGDDQTSLSANPLSTEAFPPFAAASSASMGQPVHNAAARPSHRPMKITFPTKSRPAGRMGHFVSPRASGDLPEIKRPPSRRRREIFGGLAKVIGGVRGGMQRISAGIGKFMPALLPNSTSEHEDAGSSTALFAIIIPVIIVAIAATVYIHYGRTAQYQQYLDIAVAQAAQARGMTNPTDVRRAWDSTIYYLDLAERNQKTQDSSNLRQEAQTALDNLDGILRLDFRPAIISGLSRSVQVTHMAATDTDLYMLDAARGSIIRASITNQGYEVDPSFKCEPGQYDSITVNALVDLETLPMTNAFNARVMAIDGKGNLLYCGLGDPAASSLVPPQLGWRSISAFTLDADGKNLYILDPAGSAVWQYSGNMGKFTDLPSIFFGEQVPQNMNTAIDLAANASDLYMLFQDGHVASCPLQHYDVVPMRCSDPATFVDTRPERQPGPEISDAIFTQMTFASAPDPSLYMLEPLTRAIYRFSPRADSLELRGQFRASLEQNNTLFDGPATAITISPNRYAFFSIGNQIFYATDVP